MNKTIAQGARRVICLLMVVCMAVMLGLSAATTAHADDKQKELEAKKEELQNQIDELNDQLDSVEADKATAEANKAQYEERSEVIRQKIEVIKEQIDDITAQIEAKITEIDEKQQEVDQKQAEYDERWALFKEQMAAMQRLNDGGAIALLSSATNLYELLSFSHVLEEISEENQNICDELEQQREDLENQRQDLENQKAELESQKATLDESQTELSNTQSELADSIQAADSTITRAEAEAQALNESISQAEADFIAAANELSAYLAEQNNKFKDAAISCSLNFICPLPSYKYISCQYGSGGHTGVDFAAAGGTEIYAIADGVVTVSGWHYSYGNYVQVYHGTDDQGNSYASLYAHMFQTPSVSEGQTVTQGQLLGYVGSTGNSTGNHLHLELRVNNARTNPLNYVPH